MAHIKNRSLLQQSPMEISSTAKTTFSKASLFFTTLLLFRIFYLFVVPLDLSPDEAYYWDWSRRLDWGYYSKPPMVAWINWLSTSLIGAKTWAVRMPAAFLSTGSLLFLYLLAKEMFGKKAGILAVLALVLAPGGSIPALVMTIDAPLLFFWTATLYSFWKATRSQKPIWWIAAGVSCGLGLLSKQTMVALIPFAFIFLIISKEERHHLKTVWPYTAAFTALLVVSPFLLWNLKHGWITFVHTSHHFEEAGRSNILRPGAFFAFLGSQFLVFSPITFLLLIAAPFAFSPGERRSPYIYLICTGFIPLISVALLSFKQTINANWPAPFYASEAILLGAAASLSTESTVDNVVERAIKKWFKPGLILGFSSTIFTLLLPFVIPNTPLGGSKLDPTKRLRGWKQFAREVDHALAEMPHPEKTLLIAKRRQTVSEMAFYCKENPVAYQWPDALGRIRSQYHLWDGPKDQKGWDALFVIQANRRFPDNARDHFEQIVSIGSFDIVLGQGGTRSYNTFIGKSLKGWPKK